MAFAIVAIVYADEQVKYIGILESTIGIGITIGPVIGSNLYSFCGFKITFIAVGAVILLFTAVITIFMPNTNTIEVEESKIVDESKIQLLHNLNQTNTVSTAEITSDSRTEQGTIYTDERSSAEKKCGYFDAFSDKIIVMQTLCCAYSNIVYCFQEPILSIRLEKGFGLNDVLIGLVFMISAISVVLSSILIP